MTSNERIYQTFRDLPEQSILYQTSDGEVFVEFEDATFYALSLPDLTIQPFMRPDPMPPVPTPINPDGVWIRVPDKLGTVFWVRPPTT